MMSFKRVKGAFAPRTQQPTEAPVVRNKINVTRAIGLGLIVLYNIMMLVMGVTVARGFWWSVSQPLFEQSRIASVSITMQN